MTVLSSPTSNDILELLDLPKKIASWPLVNYAYDETL